MMSVLMVLLLIPGTVDSFHPQRRLPLQKFQPLSPYSPFMYQHRCFINKATTTLLKNDETEAVDFAFQATKEKEIVSCEVTEPTVEETADRKKDEPMFTAALRRDLYKVFRNPYQPHQGAPAPLSWWGNNEDADSEIAGLFGIILLAKQSVTTTARKWDAYAFTDRLVFDAQQSEWKEYTILDDGQLLDAMARMGKANPDSIALTKAFEVWLEQTALGWGDLEVSVLSVDFLIAFGNELTDRLGVNHRIQSSALSEDEMTVLSKPPFVNYVRPELLEQFQLTNIEVDEEKAESTAGELWWDHGDDEME